MTFPTARGRASAWAQRVLASVRMRVTLAALSVALLVGLVGSALFVNSLYGNLQQAVVASARQQVQTISTQLAEGSTPGEAAVTAADDVITQVVSPTGQILGTDHPRLLTALRTTVGVETSVRVPGIGDIYAVVSGRARNGDLVIVAQSEEQAIKAREAAGQLLTVALPVALALLVGAVWVSVGQALRPVEAIRRKAALITTTQPDLRLAEPQGRDEIARLALTLNQMLGRIEASQRAHRQFVSDASHELRSPLAVIRQLAEVARRRPEHADAATLAEEILSEERRMEEMVRALLTLARLDDDTCAGGRHLVDLDDVVLAEVKRARRPDGPEIDATGVGAGQVRGEEILYGQVVRNLLSNAVRHARTRVQVVLRETDDGVVLAVADDGAGIPEDEHERIFGRFVRLDDARAREAGGSGLGLAIVDKVVSTAHGSVRVDASPAGGARFTVTLPRG